MKTIFITGASAGLGKATAKLFQSKGWKVIATMRTPEKETELNLLENVILLPLDVTNIEQIETTVKAAVALGDIDVVFNNAGYGLIGPLESYTEDEVRSQFETNFFGVIWVTKAFIPYFKERKSGLFITTTSLCGLTTYPLSSIYNASKWALQGWSESMSFDLARFNIGIKNVAPGGIKSNYMNVMKVSEDKDYDPLMERMTEGFTDGTLMEFSESEVIAEVVYRAVTDEKDQLTYPAGNDAVRIYEKRLKDGPEAFRQGITKYLNLESPYNVATL
ncbi:SDR family oxidoreductase [Dyadobacter frigoris]|uniref:SDR family oxidoreductase n=1 Tax=Dyadobacter frigoris TaxID=2576211 RepID=A0A4U6D9G4_9BACT|nr:SDR family oxidoreductase [Dyadobacter frigoris]TKT92798.1 SDR family oxidoreductase [Dyadobacter frigoris]GLU54493.1 short-chain dehydrogenase/reductase [Dyadobacter frigoris]